MEDPPGFSLVPASNPLADSQSRKGKIQHIDWDASLEEMRHDNNIARAQSGATIELAYQQIYISD
jgi:hypothetical protein